ncbi:hypothetical protein BS78_10G077700 [Paspalum vaginatum]|nr:hypothetical protein BS78_10G077700 [Paspalum vaginatum]
MVSLLDVSMLLLCAAVAGLHALDCLVPATAGAVTLLALALAHFTGVILAYLRVAPAPPALVLSPVALWLLAAMACVLLLLLAVMPLVPWVFTM